MSKDPVSVEDARKHFGSLMRAAAASGEVTVIAMNGIPAAAIVPLARVKDGQDPDKAAS